LDTADETAKWDLYWPQNPEQGQTKKSNFEMLKAISSLTVSNLWHLTCHLPTTQPLWRKEHSGNLSKPWNPWLGGIPNQSCKRWNTKYDFITLVWDVPLGTFTTLSPGLVNYTKFESAQFLSMSYFKKSSH
jgi:hypothetical protein